MNVSGSSKYLVAAEKHNLTYHWLPSNEVAEFNTSDVTNSSNGDCLLIGPDGFYGVDCQKRSPFLCSQGIEHSSLDFCNLVSLLVTFFPVRQFRTSLLDKLRVFQTQVVFTRSLKQHTVDLCCDDSETLQLKHSATTSSKKLSVECLFSFALDVDGSKYLTFRMNHRTVQSFVSLALFLGRARQSRDGLMESCTCRRRRPHPTTSPPLAAPL